MKVTDTISVNPSKTTLGHVESASSPIFRTTVIGAETSAKNFSLLSLILPSSGLRNNEIKKYEVPLRTLFATILIVCGISMLQLNGSIAYAVCCLSFGFVLAIGFLTRPVMIGASLFYCISGALSLRAGNIDINMFLLMFGSLIFALTGAGKYSFDTLLRKSIVHHQKKREIARKEKCMGYKAFHAARL